MAGHFLVKSEPSTYSWDDLVRDGSTVWDGVRNPEARNNLAAMAPGDLALVYHSGDEKAVVGIAKVVRPAFPDPKADDPKWLAVELAPVTPLARSVTLAEIKADARLVKIPLVTRGRLSVMPLDAKAYDAILAMAGKKPAAKSVKSAKKKRA
ncbi:MAG TPA: EVE domain-containing protein [Myxococcota bacterium]|nr:EVE domain-containing protein [Myxococcota bacterium]